MKRRLRVIMVVPAVFAAFFFLAGLSSSAFSEDNPTKWRQLPDMRFGINIPSTHPAPLVADDWQCRDPRPVSDVHFWGSYLGWEVERPNPTLPAPGVEGFWIRIYEDVPAFAPDVPYSHPGLLLYEQEVRVFTEQYMVSISHPDGLFEHKFYYSLDLPEPFVQNEGTIYWLSVAAIMREETQYPWGW
ncbi:MAG: hypothetical protein JRI36_09255, partial [Deltaproteobacteria bacterium]|nr:hypothetical protein [Deltaproteobacteria bacterium]